jgi:hypothetical protein
MLSCLGILLSLPQTTASDVPELVPSAPAGVDEDGVANAPGPPPDGSYPLTPADEVQEMDKHPMNASLLTTLVLALSFGASILWMLTNDLRRGAMGSWSVEVRPGLSTAREGPSFLGVFRL